MRTCVWRPFTLAAATAFTLLTCTAPPVTAEPWLEVGAEEKYDVAFAFYPLSGTSIYGTPYREHYAAFWGRFGPAIPAELQPALDGFRALKEQQGFLFGSSLARLFAQLDGGTPGELAAQLETDPPAALAEVERWGPGMLQQYQQAFKPGLVGLLHVLDGAGFDAWWQASVRPTLQARGQALLDSGAGSLKVKEELARWSLKPARAGLVRMRPVYFMLSQGQQILLPDGLVYLADADWSLDWVRLQLVHEVAHNQLLDWAEPAVQATLPVLQSDTYFAQVFEDQKLTSGYVVFQDFVEENVTEGAQLRMAPALGIPVEAVSYLRSHEGGSHVLSMALLRLEAKEGWSPGGSESFQAFFVRMVSEGKLGPGTIKALRDEFLQ